MMFALQVLSLFNLPGISVVLRMMLVDPCGRLALSLASVDWAPGGLRCTRPVSCGIRASLLAPFGKEWRRRQFEGGS